MSRITRPLSALTAFCLLAAGSTLASMPAALDARRPARTDPPAIGGARIPSAHVGPARDRAANRVRIGTMYPPPND